MTDQDFNSGMRAIVWLLWGVLGAFLLAWLFGFVNRDDDTFGQKVISGEEYRMQKLIDDSLAEAESHKAVPTDNARKLTWLFEDDGKVDPLYKKPKKRRG